MAIPGNYPPIPRAVTLSSARKADINSDVYREVSQYVHSQFDMKIKTFTPDEVIEGILKELNIPFVSDNLVFDDGNRYKHFYIGNDQSRKWYGTAILRMKWSDYLKEYILDSYFPQTSIGSDKKPLKNSIHTSELANCIVDAICRYRCAVEGKRPEKNESREGAIAGAGCASLFFLFFFAVIVGLICYGHDCDKKAAEQKAFVEKTVPSPYKPIENWNINLNE